MLGRAASALATLVVAVAVMLALPVAQLRLVSVEKSCCCPDPDRCHCPTHDDGKSTQPSMRACHSTQHVSVTPQLPAFQAPALIATGAARVAAVVSTELLATPHAPPVPHRPSAPS